MCQVQANLPGEVNSSHAPHLAQWPVPGMVHWVMVFMELLMNSIMVIMIYTMVMWILQNGFVDDRSWQCLPKLGLDPTEAFHCALQRGLKEAVKVTWNPLHLHFECFYFYFDFLGGSLQAAPKQKIRIKLRSYWVPLIEQACQQILEAARNSNSQTMGPVPLPTKKRVYCVLRSPHVNKDSREHFEIRTHRRLIDLENPNAQTIDALMQLDLPAGVDVEVKLS